MDHLPTNSCSSDQFEFFSKENVLNWCQYIYFKSKIPHILTITRWTHFIKTQVFLLLFSLQFVSDSLWCHRLQDTRFPCPSPSLRVCPNSCPLIWWCNTITSSSVTLVSFCLQYFPASGSFPMSQLFLSGGQSTGASPSASVPPVSIQGWFPLGLTGLISLLSNRLSRVFSSTTIRKHQFFGALPFYDPALTLVHNYGKNHSLDLYGSLSSHWYLYFLIHSLGLP